jgi:putative ABC transport system permease protein
MSYIGLLLAAAQEMSANRMRTAISMLSIAVGVAAVVLIVAIGDIGRAAAVIALERQTGRAATIDIETSGSETSSLSADALDEEVANRALNLGAEAVSPIVSTDAVTTSGPLVHFEVAGVWPNLSEIRRFRTVAGRWLQASDARLYAPVLVLNKPLAAALGGSAEVGGTAVIGLAYPISSRIVGIVDDGSSEGMAYGTTEAVRRWGGNTRPLRYLIWVDPLRAPAIIDRLVQAAGQWGLQMEARRLDDSNSVNTTISIIQLVLIVIAGISLVTGGLGILNLGLVTVRQRTREIGIRRALGASAADVFLLVLLESAATAAIAGVTGTAVAAIGVAFIPAWASSLVSPADIGGFPVAAAATGGVVSVALGILSGLVPALRATQIQIVDAIRS